MFRVDRLCDWCLYLVYFLMFLDLATSFTEAYKNPSSDFDTHNTVRPKLRHGRTRRDITTTKHSEGLHHTEVTLTLSIDGEDYELELRLNVDLVPDGHTLSYQQGGDTKVHTLNKEEMDICQYSGSVRGKPGSWVAVSTCHGVRGVIYDGQQMRYIEPAEGDEINGDHFLYSHEQLTKQHRCGHEGGTLNSSDWQQLGDELTRTSRANRYKRHISEDTLVREPYNVNSHTRYVELVLVVDNEEFRSSGSDIRRVHHYMKDLANIINSVYAPLNIFIALVGVELWSHHDKIGISEKSDDTLKQFARYRETELVTRIPNDNAHLLTRQKFLDSVVGKALMGVMCSKQSSAGIATVHSPVAGLVAMTIAHEMGHNFGMDHDRKEPDCKCPGQKCIMSPVSSMVTPLHWSSCSLRSLSLSFEKGMDYCLRNKPKRLLGSSTCGNGFLEEGEECDCGTAPGESAPRDSDRGVCQQCCKPDCTLRSNATCGHGQCCDLTKCHYKSAATECRSTQRECDLPEFCTGDSQFCPEDLHKMDTTPCGNKQGYCARGACHSHADQCRLLWGVTGSDADDKCYMQNSRGNQFGNCGYDQFGIHKPCALRDVKCGLLQCRHYNGKLEYGLENAVIGSSYPMYNGKSINPCRTVFTALGGGADPGMVPDGAKCGVDKMCMDHKCQSVERLRAGMAREGAVCPHNCSGHGVCNSNGNCHCDPGFAPPLCELPGPGGSYDSGPATDLSGLRIFMVVMYVIFLGIIPAIVLVLLLIYFFCPSTVSRWKKPRESYIQNLSQGTNKINGFRSKFTLPKFNSVRKCMDKNSTNKAINDCRNSNLNEPSKLVVDETPACKNIHALKSVEVSISNVIRPSANVAATTVAPTQRNTLTDINNRKIVKEPIRLNRKINKEDIVIIENYTNNAAVHNTDANNLNVAAKPKVDVARKTFKSPNNAIINTPNKEANLIKIEVVKNDFETPINSSRIMKPNVSTKPSVNSKPGIRLKTNERTKLSVKMGSENKFKAETITKVTSANNDLVNQRSKLRKVTTRDLTK